MSRAIIAEKATLASERAKEFISTGGTMVSRARTLVSGDAQFFSIQPKVEDLRRHLNSESMHEKRDAMKRIIAQMCKGRDMSNLFADVVKNIHAPSIELRKLIYFYIAHYAEDRPNEALLSISAFQKDLLDRSMHVRSLALRMLSTIRIPAIHPIVMVAVKKCASDLEPLVRKTAAISLAQMHAISGGDEDTTSMRELLQLLLADKCNEVAAAAALSFIEICPDEVQFIHRVYRDLCRSLVDCEEWGQVVLLHVLLRYARTQFCDPNGGSPKQRRKSQLKAKAGTNMNSNNNNNNNNNKDGDGSEGGDENGSRGRSHGDEENKENEKMQKSSTTSSSSSSTSTSDSESLSENRSEPQEDLEGTDAILDSDHRLLLDSVKPLFLSTNSAVIVAATAIFYHCAPRGELEVCVRSLLRLIGGPEEQHAILLSVLHTIVLSRPEPFVPYVKEFFLMPHDVKDVRELKLRIVSRLATRDNFVDLFREFRSYVRSFHAERVVEAVHGLGLIAARLAGCATQIMRLLVPLLSHKNAEVVSESVSVLRLLVVQGTDKTQTCRLVHRLMQQVMKGEIDGPSAKASILWLVGENLQLHPAIAAAASDCLRVFVKSFTKESTEVKKQVLTLGCKIWLFLDGQSTMAERFHKLFFYLLELSRFDDDYSVRDRGRLIECTVDRQTETFEGLKNAILSEKPIPQANDPYVERTQYQIGTISHLFGNALFGYHELPDWPEEMPDPTVRGVAHVEESQSGMSSGASSVYTSSSGESYSSPHSSSDYSSGSSATDEEESDASSRTEDSDSHEGSGVMYGTQSGQRDHGEKMMKDRTTTSPATMSRVPVKVIVRQVSTGVTDGTMGVERNSTPSPDMVTALQAESKTMEENEEDDDDDDEEDEGPRREDYAPPVEESGDYPNQSMDPLTSQTIPHQERLGGGGGGDKDED